MNNQYTIAFFHHASSLWFYTTDDQHDILIRYEDYEMIKKLIFCFSIAILSFANTTFANTMGVPYYCGFNSNSALDHSTTNIETLVNSGSAIYQGEASLLDWPGLLGAIASFSNTSSNSTKGPDYVLQGIPYRYKYDGNGLDLLSSRFYTVFFGTSEFGSTVETKSDWDNNAYKYLTFDHTYGVGIVWSDGKGCMAKSVMVQKPPSISKVSLTTNDRIRVKVNAAIDQYSKYSLEGNAPSITYSFRNKFTNTSESVTTTSQDYTFIPRYSGDIKVTATVFDGTYSILIPMGTAYYEGGQFCSTCGILN